MQIDLPPQTVEDVKIYLAKTGRSGDIAEFVDRSVQRALFFSVATDIQRRNAGHDQGDVDAAIEEAVIHARRTGKSPSADRS